MVPMIFSSNQHVSAHSSPQRGLSSEGFHLTTFPISLEIMWARPQVSNKMLLTLRSPSTGLPPATGPPSETANEVVTAVAVAKDTVAGAANGEMARGARRVLTAVLVGCAARNGLGENRRVHLRRGLALAFASTVATWLALRHVKHVFWS
jgi:hypothetical protein